MIKYLTRDISIKGLKETFLDSIGREAGDELGKTGVVELNFISPEEIRELNKTYRGKDMETDVLSFELEGDSIAGQVFVCYDIALEQAERYNWSIENELALLIIHGTLHVFGFDHETDAQAREMIDKENNILRRLKLKEYETHES